MNANSIVLDYGQPLDVAAIAKKETAFTLLPGLSAASAPAGDLLLVVFPSGRARVSRPGGDYAKLSDALARSGLALADLVRKAGAAGGFKGNAATVLERQAREEVDSTWVAGALASNLRLGFPNAQANAFLHALVLAGAQVLNPFQAERYHLQVGELLGRNAVAAEKPKSPDAVLKLVSKTAESAGLGRADAKTTKEFAYALAVDACYCAGAPAVGYALCGVVRGLARGAFAEFLKAENVAAEETECWGLGHARCAFDVRVTSR